MIDVKVPAPAPEYLAKGRGAANEENASCHGPNRFEHYSKRLPEADFEGAPWQSSDVPIVKLRDRWILATDLELQWIVYRRTRPDRWTATCFPSRKETVLRALRERVSDKYGTYEGVDSNALAEIQSWPD